MTQHFAESSPNKKGLEKSLEIEGAIQVLLHTRSMESFSGSVERFWGTYVKGLCRILGGSQAIAMVEVRPDWKPIAVAVQKDADVLAQHLLQASATSLTYPILPVEILGNTQDMEEEEFISHFANSQESRDWIISTLLVQGDSGHTQSRCMLSVYLEGFTWEEAKTRQSLLGYLDNIPHNFQFRMRALEAIHVQQSLGNVLDMMVLVNEKEKFLMAAMTFCNEIASRHHCDRVSLGWVKNQYIRVCAMNHRESFDKKMDATQSLELAMEEAVDQNAEVYWTEETSKQKKTSETVMVVDRDHQKYAQEQQTQHVLSIPLRLWKTHGRKEERTVVGVCTLERNTGEKAGAFSAAERKLLHLYCEQATRRFADLQENDRWVGSLVALRIRKKLASWLGFEHTWAKLFTILGALALAFICFIPVPYRIDGTTILRTDYMMYLTAPFNGHIEDVHVRVGDQVEERTPLLHLDQNDLLLEEASLLAETKRYRREMEKARAAGALADMRIAEASLEQSSARLEIVRYKIQQAVVSAAFAGVIVEGDQIERVGSPVNQGDVLFKLAQLDSLYVVAEVSEQDVDQLMESKTGTLALTSRPQEKFPVQVVGYEPAAMAKSDGNVFLVRCLFLEAPPKWFRPGMTGLVKLDAGNKTLLWILSHKTLDFLRLKLWW